MDIWDHYAKREKGQSLVETALFFTILLILLAGAIDLGGAFFAFINIRDAAEEGAIFASYDQHPDKICLHIQNSAINPPSPFSRQVDMASLPCGEIGITFRRSSDNSITNDPCAGDSVTVAITYNYELKMPFMGGRTLPLRSEVTNTVMSPVCY